MNRKLNSSSAKVTFTSDKTRSNAKNENTLNPKSMTVNSSSNKTQAKLKTEKLIVLEKNGSYGDNTTVLSSSTSSGNISSNAGDLRQKTKIIKNKENQQGVQEIESLYDDYLISELMRMNAENNYSITSEKINNEVLEMWSSIEMLKDEVQEIKEKNISNKSMLEYFDAASSKSFSIVTNLNKNLPEISRKLNDLADALGQSTYYLKVLGVTIEPNEDTATPMLKVLEETLKQLLSKFDQNADDSYDKTATQFLQLNIDFENSISAFDKCKVLLKRLRTSTLHSTSLMLTKQELENQKRKSETLSGSKEYLKLTRCLMEEMTLDKDT